jgi:acyl-coenzyme A thioesterase PaaI-like protein
MQHLPVTRGCFVCGTENPSGLKLQFHWDGKRASTTFRPDAHACGFRGLLHGGVIAAVLDETMFWACAGRARRLVVCGEMAVRFRRPVAPGNAYLAVATCLEVRRGRVFQAQATLTDAAGMELATATGSYLPGPSSLDAALIADLVGPLPEWLRTPAAP